MRRVLVLAVLSAFVVLSLSSLSLAAGEVGYVVKEKLLSNHPRFQDFQKQVRELYEKKKAEAEEQVKKLTSDDEKRKAVAAKEREFAEEHDKMLKPLIDEIEAAIRKVAQAKKLAVVLDRSVVVFGGVDITDEVIAELKKSAATKKQ